MKSKRNTTPKKSVPQYQSGDIVSWKSYHKEMTVDRTVDFDELGWWYCSVEDGIDGNWFTEDGTRLVRRSKLARVLA